MDNPHPHPTDSHSPPHIRTAIGVRPWWPEPLFRDSATRAAYNDLKFRAKIIKHAEWVTEILATHPGIADSEARTKTTLIEPLLQCLGYVPRDPEQVTLEVPTELGGKIDYVLTGEENTKIAVEAKRTGVNLSEKEINQLRSYFTFSEAVAGVLTNGVDYWLFTDLDKTNVMDAAPYNRVDVNHLTDNDIHHLETLTRSQVRQSAVHEQARRERYRKLVNEIVDQELGSPSQEFLRLIGKKAGISPLRKAHLKLLKPLVGEAISRNRRNGPPPPTPDTLQVSLFGETIPAGAYRQILISVVAELQNRHPDFAERVLKDPFVKGSRKWQYISKDEKDLSPSHQKVKVGRYFLDVNLSAQAAVTRARRFLGAFGHDSNELVVNPSPAYPKLQGATLFGETIPAKNYMEMLASVVKALQSRHPIDFAERVRDQKVFRGTKRWIISKDPDELGSIKSKRLIGDYWVYTGGTGRVPRAHKFLSAFGHSPDELVVHTLRLAGHNNLRYSPVYLASSVAKSPTGLQANRSE